VARLTAGIGDLRWPQPPRQASSRRSLNQSSPRRKSAAPAPTPRCWCPLRGCKGAAAAAAAAAAVAAGRAVTRGPLAQTSTCCPACLPPAAAAEAQGRVHHHPRPRHASVPAADRGAQAVPARGGLQRGCCPAATGGRAGGCCLTLCPLQATLSGSLLTVLAGLPTCWPACRSRPLQQQGRGPAPARDALA
jgi:hypothetical protein